MSGGGDDELPMSLQSEEKPSIIETLGKIQGKDITLFVVFFAPTIISISILMFSLFSASVGRGLFYLFWIAVITMARISIFWMNGSKAKENVGECSLGNIIPFDNATYSIFILTFTMMYFVFKS